MRKNLMRYYGKLAKMQIQLNGLGPSFEMPRVRHLDTKGLSYQQCEHCLICNSSKKCVYRYLINVYTYFVELRMLLLWPKRMRRREMYLYFVWILMKILLFNIAKNAPVGENNIV